MNAMSGLQTLDEQRTYRARVRGLHQVAKVAQHVAALHMREVGSGGRRGGEPAHCVVRSARVVVQAASQQILKATV